MFNVNTKGGARDETMKMPIVIQFVLKLTSTDPVRYQYQKLQILGTHPYRRSFFRVKLLQLK